MQRTVRYSLLVAAMLATASTFGAQIQQVAGTKVCGESCVEQPCNDKTSRVSKKQLRASHAAGNGACNNGAGYCDMGSYCQDRCTIGSTWNDMGLNWGGKCGPTGRLCRAGCPAAQKLCWCCNTKAFPDSGWSPPARMPVNRTGTGFQTFVSQGGQYSGAPMVYQPTDTAQLGYSYAHVPTWTRNPGMLPRTPSPSSFHARFCPRDPRCGGCQSNNGCLTNGTVIHGGYCPTSEPGYSQTVQQVPASGYAQMTQQPQPSMPRQQASSGTNREPEIMSAVNVQQVADSQPSPPSNFHLASQPTQPKRPVARSTSRSTQQRTPKPKGWFGLPSLKDVRF